MSRKWKAAAIAAAIGALVGSLLADAAGVEGWRKTLLTAAAAGLGVLIAQVALQSRG